MRGALLLGAALFTLSLTLSAWAVPLPRSSVGGALVESASHAAVRADVRAEVEVKDALQDVCASLWTMFKDQSTREKLYGTAVTESAAHLINPEYDAAFVTHWKGERATENNNKNDKDKKDEKAMKDEAALAEKLIGLVRWALTANSPKSAEGHSHGHSHEHSARAASQTRRSVCGLLTCALCAVFLPVCPPVGLFACPFACSRAQAPALTPPP
jgi:hypothetical protein